MRQMKLNGKCDGLELADFADAAGVSQDYRDKI